MTLPEMIGKLLGLHPQMPEAMFGASSAVPPAQWHNIPALANSADGSNDPPVPAFADLTTGVDASVVLMVLLRNLVNGRLHLIIVFAHDSGGVLVTLIAHANSDGTAATFDPGVSSGGPPEALLGDVSEYLRGRDYIPFPLFGVPALLARYQELLEF